MTFSMHKLEKKNRSLETTFDVEDWYKVWIGKDVHKRDEKYTS